MAQTPITDAFNYGAGDLQTVSTVWRQLSSRGIGQIPLVNSVADRVRCDETASPRRDGRGTVWRHTSYLDDFQISGTWVGVHPSEGCGCAFVNWNTPQVAVLWGAISQGLGNSAVWYVACMGRESFNTDGDSSNDFASPGFGGLQGVSHVSGTPVAWTFKARKLRCALYLDGSSTPVLGPFTVPSTLRYSNRHGIHADQHDDTAPGAGGSNLVGAMGQDVFAPPWSITSFTGTL